MKKTRRGMCPPFIALGLVLLFMVLSAASFVAHASDSVIPGSEVAPPGGSTTIATVSPDTTEPGDPPPDAQIDPPDPLPGEVVITDPHLTDPSWDPSYELWLQQQQGQLGESGSEGEGDPLGEVDPTVDPEGEDPAAGELTPDPVGTYPSSLDTSGVNIVSPSLDELLADGANLEELLYPSGLRLPTKFMDLMMCAPVNYASPVTSEAAYLLKTIAPVEDNTYTYAEYKAAEVYLAMCRMYLREDNLTDTAVSVRSLDANTSVNWVSNITNASLGSSSHLTALISSYKDILEQIGSGATITKHRQYSDFIADHKGVRYSCGDFDALTGLASGSVLRDADLSSYVLSLYSWWDYIGVTQNLTSAVLDYSTYYNEFAYNGVNFNKGAPVATAFGGVGSGSGGGIAAGGDPATGTVGGNTTTVTGPEGGVTGTNPNVSGSSTSSDWVSGGAGADTPVSSVGSTAGADRTILPTGARNLGELGSIVAVVFVAVAVIGLLIIRISRRGGKLF